MMSLSKGLGLVLASLLFVAIGSHIGLSQPEMLKVRKGIFSLKEGQSADLTDRSILLHVVKVTVDKDGVAKGVVFTVNGGGGGEYRTGIRKDLKQLRQSREFLKDVRECFLDLVGAVAPRGAPASATFRLLCD